MRGGSSGNRLITRNARGSDAAAMVDIALKSEAPARVHDDFLSQLIFGELRQGCLTRGEFMLAAIAALSLYALAIVVVSGILLLIGVMSPHAPATAGMAIAYAAVLLLPLLFFAGVNIVAKRARHAGLPGRTIALGFAALNMLFFADATMLTAVDASALLVLTGLPRAGV